jgi:hypothetical protein
MKPNRLLPAAALAGGLLGFLLRLAQNRTGFEPDSGLPIPGTPAAMALVALLLVAAAGMPLLARRLPAEREDTPLDFSAYFSAAGNLLPTLLVCAVFLWALSGGLQIAAALTDAGGAVLTATGYLPSHKLPLLLGVLSVASAVCLIPLAAACLHGKRASTRFNGNLLMVPVACLVSRLVLVYREDSVNPALSAYYVEILALTCLILSLYRASSFAFHCGRTRRFAVYTAWALMLCLTVLPDCATAADALFYAGGALLTLALLLLRLNALRQQPSAEA